ncbi:MAG: hypothetical protein LBS11_09805 [Oscillospiraceae bacterium]|nr:hypothetical protein [Oscillospiraceae bacterium]
MYGNPAEDEAFLRSVRSLEKPLADINEAAQSMAMAQLIEDSRIWR